MELKRVESSSNVYATGHDPESNRMQVQFTDSKDRSRPGKTYQHDNVPAEKYAAFETSSSKGRFYAENFRGNPSHPCRVVSSP